MTDLKGIVVERCAFILPTSAWIIYPQKHCCSLI